MGQWSFLYNPPPPDFSFSPRPEKTRQDVFLSWKASCCVQEVLYCSLYACKKKCFFLLSKPSVFTLFVMYKTDSGVNIFYSFFYPQNETSIQEHVNVINSTAYPYLLAVGMKRSAINKSSIALDKQVIPCKSKSSLGAFDELFKAHFVFGTIYNLMLHNMYTFIQTTVKNIDTGKVQESPRVTEVRARLLH